MHERVLITGGSGFIGACLARELVAEGHDVHLLLRPDYSRWRLGDIEDRFTPQWADVRDLDAVRQAVASSRPDVVYHLAALGTMPSPLDRTLVLATSITGTVNLLEALAHCDYRALVFAGSSSEYSHKDRPIAESDCLEPRTDYAIAKAAASHLVLAEGYRGRPVCVVRIFSAYGQWEDPSRVASYVMDCCLRRERAQVTNGDEPRDFIHVEDVVRLLRTATTEPQARGEILHAGSGRTQTVRDMVESIVSHCGGPPADFGARPARANEPAVWQARIARTFDLTGWRPRIDLRKGVARMWDWYRAHAARRQVA